LGNNDAEEELRYEQQPQDFAELFTRWRRLSGQ
jgi:hypothetical protein